MAKYGGIRKAIRKVGQAFKKRYKSTIGGRKLTGGYRVGKMARDIMYLKSVLNPEKKRYLALTQEQLVGQVNGNTDGGYYADVTPTPIQGNAFDQRNGASIKLHSTMWHFQFTQQVGVICDIKLCIEIFRIEGEPYTGFTFRNERYLNNFFITGADIRDYNTQINPDNFMKGKLVARRYIKLKEDATGSTKNVFDLKILIKYNNGQGHHIRFNRDTQTVEHGQLVIVIRADRGNIGALSTLTGIPDVGLNTGVSMSYNRTDFFYDN